MSPYVEGQCAKTSDILVLLHFIVKVLEHLPKFTLTSQSLELSKTQMSMVNIIKKYSYPDDTVVSQSHLLQQMQMASSVQLLLLLSSLFLVPDCLLAQTTNDGKVDVGASLTATAGNSSSWLSPSGDFAFGFRQLENSDLFLLSVWYAKIPDKTIVWYAYGDNSPAVVAKGSIVNLTAVRGLVLTNPQGVQLWKSDSISGVVAFGVLNDTGNFVLQDDNSVSLWETFNNPTHTILPGQVVEKGGNLWSQQSETDFTKGRFQLRMQDDGNLVLVTINLPTEFANSPYYASDTDDGTNASTAGTKLEFNSSGYLYVLRVNGGKFNFRDANTVSSSSFYLRATLNFDGGFALYSYPRTSTGNASWSPVWSVPDNICAMLVDAGLGICGSNSICTLLNQRPICVCPTGFSLSDSKNPNGNCNQGSVQICNTDERTGTKDLFEVVVLRNTDWPTSDYMQLKPSTAESCNASCFEDCMCHVAIYRSDTCWKKKLPLSNGRVDTSLNSQAFIKVGRQNSTQQVPHSPNVDDRKKIRKPKTLMPVESILLATSGFVNFMLIAAVSLGCLFIFQKNKLRGTPDDLDTNLHSFSYKELEEATNGFKEELGRGSFGVVYKGKIETAGVEVAVKRLSSLVQDGEKEFKTEVNVIGRTHHRNLVHLVGYCDEGQHRLLVYEFLSNGTLASFLFADTKPSWRLRIEIAYGVAKGLLYLHEQCSTQIIHCDIKPQNILLDTDYNARISDFGLAKLLMVNQSKTHTVIRGTKGYVAPEWFRNMLITTKVDVFSFGIVLLEVICCRRSIDMENTFDEGAILADWVYDCYHEGLLEAVVDNEIEALHEKTKLKRFVMVAIWCVQEDPSLRPTMRTVVRMLEGVVEVHAPPCPWPYSRKG